MDYNLDKLKEIIFKKGIKVTVLAKATDISYQMLRGYYLTGKTILPIDKAYNIAKFFETTVENLFYDKEHKV